jgi:hypothetical protein
VELEKEEAAANAKQGKKDKDVAADQLRRNALPDVYPEPKTPKG